MASTLPKSECIETCAPDLDLILERTYLAMPRTARSRRRPSRVLTIVSALLATAIMLTACDSSAPPQTAPSTGSTTPAAGLLPPAEGKTQYPLVLKTAWGETTIASRPERIVDIGAYGPRVDLLFSIGVTPIASREFSSRETWLQGTFDPKNVTQFEGKEWNSVPLETVASFHPDLVIGYELDLSTDFGELSKIAPVVANHPGEEPNTIDWRPRLIELGRILDLQDAAASVIAEYDKRMAQVASEHPNFADYSIAQIMYFGKDIGLWYQNPVGSSEEEFYTSLGFRPADSAAAFPGDQQISAELFGKIDADVLVFITNKCNGAEAADILNDPLFRMTPAMQADRVLPIELSATCDSFIVDGTERPGNLAMAIAQPSPLSLLWATDEIVPPLAKKLG